MASVSSKLGEIRDFLDQKKRVIRQQHEQGASGRQIGSELTELVDQALVRMYEQELAGLAPDQVQKIQKELAIVALGGYGRGDLAPYSDIDLLFLLRNEKNRIVLDFAKRMVRHVWDIGLRPGHNLATAHEFLNLASQQTATATALLDARQVLGSDEPFATLRENFDRRLRKGWTRRLCLNAASAIREEHHKFGATVHLLEPDVKRTSGGLRDLHLLRWLGRLLYGAREPSTLLSLGVLVAEDAKNLENAHEFLLSVRADLHFHAGRASDVLTRGEQLRIAQRLGYRDSEFLLAVEQFMRDYFRHTTSIAEIVDRFVKHSLPKSRIRKIGHQLLSRRCGPGIWLTPEYLQVSATARPKVLESLLRILELTKLAAEQPVDFDRDTFDALRFAYLSPTSSEGEGLVQRSTPNLVLDRSSSLPSDVTEKFLQILSRPGCLHRLVRTLHQVGVLERLIPQFEHARGLLQFNAYHKYTVDEHTFVMLESAEELAHEEGLLGKAYRRIVRKDLLHLAILLHDLGKGTGEDHSEVGKRIAESIARRFRLCVEDTRTLVFLVHKHLFLPHLAFRRDTADPKVWVHLTREVGTEQLLCMLYVITAADLMAVGPGNYTHWKGDILADLYRRSLQLLAGEEVAQEDPSQSIREKLLIEHGHDPQKRKYFESLPPVYLGRTPLEDVVADCECWQRLDDEGVVTRTKYRQTTGTTRYTVLTHERLTEGIFHKICAALSAHQLEIHSAQIHTLPDGTVIDEFEVEDKHHAGTPSPERCKRVGETIRRVLIGEVSIEDVLWSSRSSIFAPKKRFIGREKTRVVIDNDSSESCTVIDVFTVNRRGLLHTLAKGMTRLGLSIELAKIATYSDEVVDVFYVTEFDGRKVHRADRIRQIQDHLYSDIQRLATDPRSMGF